MKLWRCTFAIRAASLEGCHLAANKQEGYVGLGAWFVEFVVCVHLEGRTILTDAAGCIEGGVELGLEHGC